MSPQPPFQESALEPRQVKWLSCGIAALVDERPWLSDPKLRSGSDHDFDVVIVGSGYGGAVAAAELSGSADEGGRPLSVCVLERGQEYLAGAFPSRQADLAGYVRFVTPDAPRQSGALDGLYDIRWSEDAVVLVASGLGGGSLINAGVMEMPRSEVFREARWPHAIRHDEELEALANQLRPHLGAHQLPDSRISALKKTSQLAKLDKDKKTRPTRITVAAAKGPNSAGVVLNECLMCGDCATGCNNGAKDSLDLNLLVLAARNGARIVTGATVLHLTADHDGKAGWVLHVNHTDNHLRDRQLTPFQIRAKRVILSAGTLGSTEILLRSRDSLGFSDQLGRKFSANGDMLVTAYGLDEPANAVADETEPPTPSSPKAMGPRAIGPTITAMIDLRTGNPDTDLVIQDLAVPGPLRRLFEEATTTFDVLNQLSKGDWNKHGNGEPKFDNAAVDPSAMKNSLVLAMIGRDDAEGELSLGDHRIRGDADGLLTVRWPALRMDPRFDDHHRRLETMINEAKVGGRVVNNLLWRPFSDKLERLFGPQRGPLVTVHPLGGCAMGDDVRQGVTDHCGRVFDARGSSERSLHEGLVVLDGSIVPTSLGINPALTISVLALRAITRLKKEWRLTAGDLKWEAATDTRIHRPAYAFPPTITDPKPTCIELTEQVRGCVKLRTRAGRRESHQVELTLTTEPAAVAHLIAHLPAELRGFRIAPGKGKLIILKAGTDFDAVADQPNIDHIALEAEISGELRLFALEASNPILRTIRALGAWVTNRGLRDLVQWILENIEEVLRLRPPADDRSRPRRRLYRRVWDFMRGISFVCSRAGAVRLIEYDLTIGKVAPGSNFDAAAFEGQRVLAIKRLTYGRAASPFTQLLGMSLRTFPEMRRPIIEKYPLLQLNKRYLARQQVPLLRVVSQQDGIAALTDLLSFALYVFRVIVQCHALSFRKPDPPLARMPQRLPGKVPGLPAPEIEWLTVDGQSQPPARIRLTRYNGLTQQTANTGTTRPVLLIHGYSASGTTFAHPEVPGNLARALYEAGRDVWVLDMRCSAGLPETATGDWPFEVMADHDIPLAIEHVATKASPPYGNASKVDIVAHCMGAAMFSMAVLGDGQQQKRLHQKIGRVVFSQVGPVMMLSRTNVLAAYIMRFARRFLSSRDYAFSPQGRVSLAGQLLDRALAAMSMPRHEYRRENPRWKAAPWAGTRHRMDALYGRTFSLKNVSKGVLDHLDDFFGPISIETVSQVIHFAGYNTVTDRRGINHYVTPTRIAERLNFPMMSIHGEENGLVDVATLALMRNTFEKAGVPHINAMSKSRSTDDQRDPVTKSQKAAEIEQLINDNSSALALGHPSYLTWRIRGHGHQDCLIGKKAQTISRIIAKYLAVPEGVAHPPRWAPATIKKRNHPSAYQAVAPAFGVRARILDNTKVSLQACDSAGRGLPLAALVVPVKHVGERLAMVWPDGSSAMPTNHESIRQAGICIGTSLAKTRKEQEAGSPYFFEVPIESWPSHASEVLVLLLYDQAEGIGGNPRPPRRMLGFADQARAPIARAITEALLYDSLDDLRGGLIRGSLTSQRPQERVTFALASCLYPSDIFNHMPAAEHATPGPADASLLALGALLGKPDSPTLLLLAGDQIYVDATAGLFDPKVKDERYRIPHERRIESRGARAVMQRLDLDVQMMLDDHEIQDNWAPNDPDLEQPRSGETALERGKSAYFLYERASPTVEESLWHKLSHRGLPFFLADTRTQREPRAAGRLQDAKIMQSRQFDELCNWLVAPEFHNLPKFVMTASALLPRRLTACALASDAWDGYPSSLYALLQFICDNEVEGLVFLSGDEHLSSVVKAHVSCIETEKQCAFHSIHSSSLFAPYPFANSSPDEFISNDAFEFTSQDGTRRYRCQADTQFFPGDGFALLTARKDCSDWCLDANFHNEAGLKHNGAVSFGLFARPRRSN
jgi:cholesterol oxidase